MSISMALILIAFVIQQLNIDKDYPKIDRIYRLYANENIADIREDFREVILDRYSEIEDACRYNNFTTTVTYNDKPVSGQMITTDSSFFNIFSSKFTMGSPHSSLNNLNDVVLTQSFARKIFGNENPVGKILIAEYKEPLTVSGIIEDLPKNSSIQGDFFTNSKLKIIWTGSTDPQGNRIAFFRLFVLVRNPGNVHFLEEFLSKDFSAGPFREGRGYLIDKINFVPFADSYFMQGVNKSMTTHANIRLIRLLSIISCIIILLAVFNYTNLATAMQAERYKEIGIKKSVGADKQQLFTQFMAESFLICFISFGLAVMLTMIWIPFFENFLEADINLKVLLHPIWLGWMILGIVVISFVSGIYPALSISKLKPVSIFRKNQAVGQNSLGLRTVLNTLQFGVSIALIITLIVLSKQIDYVRAKDFGFDTDKLIRVGVHWRLVDKTGLIRDKLLSYPTIKSVCFSHGSPGSIYSTSTWHILGEQNNIINELTVDSAFFNVFQIPIAQGRNLLPSDFDKACYINETAFKKTGWDTFEGKSYHGLEVIGVVKDFNFENLYSPITPLVVQVSSRMGVSHLTLRVTPANISQTINALKETWSEICTGHPLDYQFYDQWLNSMYKSEERLAASIRLFAILAIVISCMGILGLAEFSIKKRTKEIGIRKVNGAKVSEILTMLNKDFVKWIVIAFIIATPIAYYAMNKWLENFAYKTSLSWWIFALAGVLALGIALLTVSWQSWRAATRNPVEALRYE